MSRPRLTGCLSLNEFMNPQFGKRPQRRVRRVGRNRGTCTKRSLRRDYVFPDFELLTRPTHRLVVKAAISSVLYTDATMRS